MKNYYLTLFAGVLSFFSFTTSQAQQTCFTISDSENKIYKFRLSDGAILSSKSLSSLSSPEASTLNLAGDTLWILNADELHYVDINTSLTNYKVSGSNISGQTLSGSLGNRTISDFDAMSVDVNGNIWAGSSNNDPCLMVVIDPSTGNVKEDFFGTNKDYLQVDNSMWSSLRFDAMAFDPLTNELYANMNGTSQNYDYLFKINTTTGAMELVRQFNTIDDVEGMGFDALGELYVTTGANASSTSLKNRLWHVDLNNGEVTEQYSLWGGDIETCDCVFGDPITTVEASGYVFYDENKDTTFNSSEVGKSGYLVSIYEDANSNGKYDAGDVFVDSMRTYADGYYNFRMQYDGGTDNYVIVSDTGDLPTDYYYTTDNIETASFTAGRQVDENNNFGFVIDSAQLVNIISGTVFADRDEDEIRDASEIGVAGVKVRLYKDANCNGVIDNNDEVLDSTIVGSNGYYSFIQTYAPDTTTTSGSSTVTVSQRISSRYDDAEEASNGDMYRTSSDLDLGEDHVGLRFTNLNIPDGANISEAYITFTAQEDEYGSARVKIYGQDLGNPVTFSSNDDDITDRTKTSASKTWNIGTWSGNSTYNTPDITDIVEEIVDRGDWSSGNSMVFIIKYEYGDRDAHSYDGSSSKAPLLVVKYTTTTTSTSNDSTVCYATSIDESTVPAGSYLTTDNIETAEFTSGGNHDSLNDFGLWGGALPVEWLSFTGKYVGDQVRLDWSTGSEENNSHFIIERTHDGAHWEQIGEVAGAGWSTEINRYMFIDENPYSDFNYYRIKQVDYDGEFDYSKVVLVSSMVQAARLDLTVHPNPANDFARIRVIGGSKNTRIDIINLQGVLVKHITVTDNPVITLDATNLDTGIYFVKYNNGLESITKKLVVKH